MTPQEQEALSARLRELEAWRNQVDKDLPAEKRTEINTTLSRWKTYVAATIMVLTLLGIGTPAAISVFIGYLNANLSNKIRVAQGDLSALVDEQAKKADRRLTELVSDPNLQNSAMVAAQREFERKFEHDLDQSFFTHVTGIASGVKTLLEMQQSHPPDFPSSIKDPRQIKELLYALDAILEQYKGVIASGRMPPDRREAFLYLVNGIVDRARGNDQSAVAWFDLAIRKDERFIEAKIFKAKIYLEDTSYLGKGKWSNENRRLEALELFEAAATSPEANENLEMRRSRCVVSELQARELGATNQTAVMKFREAIAMADTAILQEGKERGAMHIDPRLFYRKGMANYYLYCDQRNETNRVSAVEAFLQAIRIDPEYIKAANNFFWMSSHDYNDNILNIEDSRLNEDIIWEMRQRLEQFEKHPLVKYNAEMLNTASEAHLLIAKNTTDAEAALRCANRAIDVARLYDRKNLKILSDRRTILETESKKRGFLTGNN